MEYCLELTTYLGYVWALKKYYEENKLKISRLLDQNFTCNWECLKVNTTNPKIPTDRC